MSISPLAIGTFGIIVIGLSAVALILTLAVVSLVSRRRQVRG